MFTIDKKNKKIKFDIEYKFTKKEKEKYKKNNLILTFIMDLKLFNSINYNNLHSSLMFLYMDSDFIYKKDNEKIKTLCELDGNTIIKLENGNNFGVYNGLFYVGEVRGKRNKTKTVEYLKKEIGECLYSVNAILSGMYY